MQEYRIDSNQIHLQGRIVQGPDFSHQLYSDSFYRILVEVPRLSGVMDCLPVTLGPRMMARHQWKVGMLVDIAGQIRSYNRMEGSHNRLVLTVYAHRMEELSIPGSLGGVNDVTLAGTLCRPPAYRTTPLMRRISDLLIAVNRPYHKSDYIPAIAWGERAQATCRLRVGERVVLTGRMQSREYIKRIPGEPDQVRTAYEVSVSRIRRETGPEWELPRDTGKEG